MPLDTPAVAVEQRHGWLIPPAWEFISEVWRMNGSGCGRSCMTMRARFGLFGSNRLNRGGARGTRRTRKGRHPNYGKCGNEEIHR